jgi:hypothetical protein
MTWVGEPAEVALARPEHHRHHVEGDLVDEPGLEYLSADIAGGHTRCRHAPRRNGGASRGTPWA